MLTRAYGALEGYCFQGFFALGGDGDTSAFRNFQRVGTYGFFAETGDIVFCSFGTIVRIGFYRSLAVVGDMLIGVFCAT